MCTTSYSFLISFITANISRCCPLRCRGRLLRLLRCSTTRTIKLSTLERSVFFFTNHQATKCSRMCKEYISKVGTIVRSLGHCPSESQLQEVKYILHWKMNACPMSFQTTFNFLPIGDWRDGGPWADGLHPPGSLSSCHVEVNPAYELETCTCTRTLLIH